MRTTRHDRAMVGAAAVPTAASILLVLVIGPLLPAWGAWAFLPGWPAAVALSVPPVGERWLPVLIWRARPATPAEQHTLADALRRGQLEVAVPRLRVRITSGDDVRAYGSRTLLVGEGVVAAVRARTLQTEHLAAITAHQLGLAQVGATRADPVLHVLAWPWNLIAAVRIPLLTPLLRMAMAVRALYVPLLAFLAWTERDVAYLMAMVVLVLSYVPAAQRSRWMGRRRALGDELIAGTTLAAPFGEWLLSQDRSAATYERVYALVLTARPGRPLVRSAAPWW
ncbi:hypothetical protein [Ornithinimicrobium panacihumi]|uniref:hypothetical protein n=1 Tax=Ornithinimicrobium panacihumi TaxID=2008449 RepID=UPI003F8A82EB